MANPVARRRPREAHPRSHSIPLQDHLTSAGPDLRGEVVAEVGDEPVPYAEDLDQRHAAVRVLDEGVRVRSVVQYEPGLRHIHRARRHRQTVVLGDASADRLATGQPTQWMVI